ncbi:hypothetical protein HK099_006698 [Clydaea vesicula]|uniref:Mitochondrial carrier n=1 Tax=Clydaea vesicula TaxID=447962 RepID=A0AAD5XWU0_9FUNG|nr:hypothetical protein HK099_006698 [Clydaea vesicula]KAJ3379737.1 hypothetical protein HDU92_006472 [Lobulomyces angularis]
MDYAFAGAMSGLVAGIIVCPLDVVKVRLQNQPPISLTNYNGTFPTLVRIAKEEGLKGLFSGLSPTILSYLCDRMLWFATYESFKVAISNHTTRKLDDPFVHSGSALLSSVVCVVGITPLWVIRTRMMTQNTETIYYYRSVSHAFKSIIKKEGLTSLYRGLIPSFLGIAHPLIQFPLYERFKIVISNYEHHSKLEDYNPNKRPELSNLGILTSSIVSKFIAAVITYPHEVIRTRLQTQTAPLNKNFSNNTSVIPNIVPYNGIVKTVKNMVVEEGWKSLYKGLPTNLIRTIPSAGISLWTYEMILNNMKNI